MYTQSWNRIHNYKTCKFVHSHGDAHFITFSCALRQPLLVHQGTSAAVANSIARACRSQNAALWAYVIMEEHVHLLIKPRRDDYSTSRFLWQVKRSSSILRATHYREITGRLWQEGGGYDRNLYSREEISEKLRYIHQNPVKRGLCVNEREYRWSSAAIQSEDVDNLIDLTHQIDVADFPFKKMEPQF